jgi:DTW domain-containing protein
MKIFLLTHSKEPLKKTNTGKLVKQIMGEQAEVIIWERKKPNPQIIQLIKDNNIALLYPSSKNEISVEKSTIENYILIDGTWQQAQKIFNLSTYLHIIPTFNVSNDSPSEFVLRRNQREGCLCTAECAIEILKDINQLEKSDKLSEAFMEHLKMKSTQKPRWL